MPHLDFPGSAHSGVGSLGSDGTNSTTYVSPVSILQVLPRRLTKM